MENIALNGIRDIIIESECVWIIADAINGLLKYDLSKKKLDLISMYPDSIKTDNCPFFKIIKMGNDIFFMPLTANDIFYYDLNESVFHKLNLPSDYFCNIKHMHVVEYENYIYCINRFQDLVIKIDSVTKEWNIFVSDANDKKDDDMERVIYRIYREPCLHENKIIWSNYNDFLTIFDIYSNTFSFIPLEGIIHKPTRLEHAIRNLPGKLHDWVIGVRSYGDMLWLFTFEGQVYQYAHGRINKIEDTIFYDSKEYSDECKVVLPFFYDVVYVNNELWFVFQYRNHYIKYDGNRSEFKLVSNEYIKDWDGYKRHYSLCKTVNKRIITFSYFEDCFYIFDIEKCTITTKKIIVPIVEFIKENANFRKIMIKNNFYGFDDLLFLFYQVIDEEKKREKSYKNIGEIVYSFLK